MLVTMTDMQTPAAPEQDTGPATEPDNAADGQAWGRALDVLGIFAGVALVVIVVDIWTDGRFISRRLFHAEGGADIDQPGDQ